ncbi:MAG: hypothetical protein JOZ72_14895 [Alphaproteobacteria bacterium]|nr:hypothetical protein [Alphaproteobacteria bacterium]
MNVTKIAVFGAVLCLAANADAQTMRKNLFYFSTPDLSQGFHFDLKQYEVTKGQPWGGVTTDIDTKKHYAEIYVMAGRKGSYDTGFWFRAQVGSGAALGSGAAKSKLPEDLNFGIRGDLAIAAGDTHLLCKDVVIGQGHQFDGSNNWWVGGASMKPETTPQGRRLLVQACDGGTAKIGIGGVGNNNFDLYVYGPDGR